jgi:tetratricopeptide (TPR) repeat protein
MTTEAEAIAAVERAEREPLLGSRIAAVRAAIDAAAPLLDQLPVPQLRARILLRLASVKLAEQDYEGADQALEAVARHVPDDTTLRFLCGVRACRVAIRRNAETRKLARDTLLNVAARLDAFETNAPAWDGVTTEVALAIAELALHDDEPDPSAFEPIAQIVNGLTGDPRHADTAFTGHLVLGAFALQTADPERAVRSLRAAVQLAKDAGSPRDEVEARLALASALVATDSLIALDEALRTVQVARDRTLEHQLADLHQATLVAQAGVLSAAGKTAGAIDRVLELARIAVAKQDVPQYVGAVAIMAELYAKTGDHVSAFRTIAESHAALAAATNSDTTALFRPLLQRLRERIGGERLDRIAREVEIANRLADQIGSQKAKHPD